MIRPLGRRLRQAIPAVLFWTLLGTAAPAAPLPEHPTADADVVPAAVARRLAPAAESAQAIVVAAITDTTYRMVDGSVCTLNLFTVTDSIAGSLPVGATDTLLTYGGKIGRRVEKRSDGERYSIGGKYLLFLTRCAGRPAFKRLATVDVSQEEVRAFGSSRRTSRDSVLTWARALAARFTPAAMVERSDLICLGRVVSFELDPGKKIARTLRWRVGEILKKPDLASVQEGDVITVRVGSTRSPELSGTRPTLAPPDSGMLFVQRTALQWDLAPSVHAFRRVDGPLLRVYSRPSVCSDRNTLVRTDSLATLRRLIGPLRVPKRSLF